MCNILNSFDKHPSNNIRTLHNREFELHAVYENGTFLSERDILHTTVLLGQFASLSDLAEFIIIVTHSVTWFIYLTHTSTFCYDFAYSIS